MHSKWKIWDFTKSYPKGLETKDTGVTAYFGFDPIINSLIKETIPKDIFDNNSLNVYQGKSVKKDWFEDNFLSMSLFGNSESICITKAEDLDSEIKEMILNSELILEGRYLLLFFEKNDDLFKKLSKVENINSFKIDPPAFWEYDKLVDYFANQKNIHLSFEAKQSILEYVEPTCINLYNLMSVLEINFEKEEISLEMLSEVLEKSKLDNFEMASLFGFKKMNDFYKKLIDLNPDFETLRSLFYFLQTHMIKVADPSYIELKSKPSKYDKQIQSQARVWKLRELSLVIDFLKDLEFKARIKNPYIYTDIKSAYYRSLS